MSAGNFKLKTESGALLIEVFGKINEETVLDSSQFDSAQRIVVDLSQVQSINSIGLRTWLRWVGSIPSSKKLEFHKIPRVVVDQCNMILGFLPSFAEIVSLYVPYFCTFCEHSSKKLVELKSKNSNVLLETSIPCEHCQKPTELDVIPGNYLKFLSR